MLSFAFLIPFLLFGSRLHAFSITVRWVKKFSELFAFTLSVFSREALFSDRADGPTAELFLFHYFHGRPLWHGSTRLIEMVCQ